MTRDSILLAVETMARLAGSDDGQVVVELVRQGLAESDAEFAVALIPLAFGRATIARISSCEGLRLPDFAEIPDSAEAPPQKLHLDCVPHFSIARELAEEAFSTGVVGRANFQAVSLRSAEMQAVNRALHQGRALKGATMAPPLLLRLGEFQRLKSRQQRTMSARRPTWLRRLLDRWRRARG